MELGEAVKKRARASGGGGECSAGGPDLLSALPDCLLHVILSFVKARQAVQTCVLSTRWRELWRSVPCLDIDFDDFKKAPASGGNYGPNIVNLLYDSSSDSSDSSEDSRPYHRRAKDKYKDWEDFEDFAVTLMHRHNIAQLDSLRLHIGSRALEFSVSQRIAAGWLRRAMKYCAPDRATWRLKRLHLGHVYLDDRILEHVSSVCRSLEDLELEKCSCEIRSITSNSLKNLVLKNCSWRKLCLITSPTLKTLVIDGFSSNGCDELVIMLPTVTYLHLALKWFYGAISLKEKFVHVHLQNYSYGGSKLWGKFKFLCSISNTTSLGLVWIKGFS